MCPWCGGAAASPSMARMRCRPVSPTVPALLRVVLREASTSTTTTGAPLRGKAEVLGMEPGGLPCLLGPRARPESCPGSPSPSRWRQIPPPMACLAAFGKCCPVPAPRRSLLSLGLRCVGPARRSGVQGPGRCALSSKAGEKWWGQAQPQAARRHFLVPALALACNPDAPQAVQWGQRTPVSVLPPPPRMQRCPSFLSNEPEVSVQRPPFSS